MKSASKKKKAKFRSILKKLGPGLITAASDDDPSGIATYSQAGAKFGTSLLWTAILTYPMMVVMQEMCAKIGLVTRRGLTGVIKDHYPKFFLYLILLVSFASITLNIGADIAAMGAVGNLMFPQISPYFFSVAFTIILLYAIITWSYRKISLGLKFLCIVLFCYLAIPFLVKTDWPSVLRSTFLPSIQFNNDFFVLLVGILGTTISPYLFFWQASMEVEEEIEQHLVVDKTIFFGVKVDVRTGLIFTNLVFFFIILTSATVLFKAGVHQIDTVDQAAQALRPLAGEKAYLLFAVGVIGTGALAIPVLAGSLSYMMAEVFDWEEGLNKKFFQAKGFYITLIVSMLIGLLIHISGITPFKALYYTAVFYGLVAPIVILLILHICNNPKIMGEYVNSRWANIIGVFTFLVMAVSAIILVVLWKKA